MSTPHASTPRSRSASTSRPGAAAEIDRGLRCELCDDRLGEAREVLAPVRVVGAVALPEGVGVVVELVVEALEQGRIGSVGHAAPASARLLEAHEGELRQEALELSRRRLPAHAASLRARAARRAIRRAASSTSTSSAPRDASRLGRREQAATVGDHLAHPGTSASTTAQPHAMPCRGTHEMFADSEKQSSTCASFIARASSSWLSTPRFSNGKAAPRSSSSVAPKNAMSYVGALRSCSRRSASMPAS